MLYELLYIIPTPYTEKDAPKIQGDIDKILGDAGAKITREDNLDNKKLAYPIKQVRRGFYILINMEIPPESLKQIEQKLKLMPEVLRFQIIKIKTTKKQIKPRDKSKLQIIPEPGEKPVEKVDLKTLEEKIDELLEI